MLVLSIWLALWMGLLQPAAALASAPAAQDPTGAVAPGQTPAIWRGSVMGDMKPEVRDVVLMRDEDLPALVDIDEVDRHRDRDFIVRPGLITDGEQSVVAERNGANRTGGRIDLPLTVNGCLSVFRHHISTTSRVYLEASALSIHLGNDRAIAEHLQLT